MNERNLPHNHGGNEEKIREHLPGENEIAGVSEALKQLGDPSRLRIFWLLCHCEECVTNLSAMIQMSSPAVSHHLRQLRSAGLIVNRREGKEVYYTAAPTEQAMLLHRMIEDIMEITCPAEEESVPASDREQP